MELSILPKMNQKWKKEYPESSSQDNYFLRIPKIAVEICWPLESKESFPAAVQVSIIRALNLRAITTNHIAELFTTDIHHNHNS